MSSIIEKIINKSYDVLIFIGMSINMVYRFFKSRNNSLIKQYVNERLGKVVFKPIQGKKVYWIHAVSVGEVGAAKIVARDLKLIEENAYVVLTVFTLTGYEEAKKYPDLMDATFFCPIDTTDFIKWFLSRIKPLGLIIIDGDFWPKMILETKRRGIPIFVANAILYERV